VPARRAAAPPRTFVAPDRAVIVELVQGHHAGGDAKGVRVTVQELPARSRTDALRSDVDPDFAVVAQFIETLAAGDDGDRVRVIVEKLPARGAAARRTGCVAPDLPFDITSVYGTRGSERFVVSGVHTAATARLLRSAEAPRTLVMV